MLYHLGAVKGSRGWKRRVESESEWLRVGNTRLHTEDGGCHQPQGWAAPRCWKKQEKAFSPKAPKAEFPFGPGRFLLDVRPREQWRADFVLFEAAIMTVGNTSGSCQNVCFSISLTQQEDWSSQCRRHGRQRERMGSTCHQTARSDEDQKPKQRGDSRGEINP